MGGDKMSNAVKTLYVSDMDGTLLSPDTCITPCTAALLNEAIAMGCLFTVATARTPATVYGLLKDVNMKLPAIVMTGSALWDGDSGRYYSPSFLAEADAHYLAETYQRAKFPAFVYTLKNNKIHIYHTAEITPLEQHFIDERIDSPFKEFFIGESLPEHLDNVLLFYAMQPTAKTEAIYNEIKSRSTIYPVYYHDIFGPETGILEVFSANTSKADAIKRLAVAEGVDRIVAFGDNINDIPMLKCADVAIAVANAVDAVKEVADEVIDSNADDAVARWILGDMRKNK
jgi:hypothetical protein